MILDGHTIKTPVPGPRPLQVLSGPQGPQGTPGGSDADFAGHINNGASQTRAALSATYAPLAEVWAPPPSGGDDAPTLRALVSVPNRTVRLRAGTYLLATRIGSTEADKECLNPANGVKIIGIGRGVTASLRSAPRARMRGRIRRD